MVLEDSMELEAVLQACSHNADNGEFPDLNAYFKEFGGEFIYYVCDYQPVKAYGVTRPSLIRLYAIRICDNCYLIVGGGVKLRKTVQESPGLELVITRMKMVLAWLKERGVIEPEDLLE